MKDRKARIAEQQRIQAVLKEEGPRLRTLPGVRSVGIGFRIVEGQTREEVVIRIYVDIKLPADEVPEGQMIPASVANIKTDVVEFRPTVKAACTMQGPKDKTKYPSLKGGMMISNDGPTYLGPNPGTLGCLAWYTNPTDAEDPNNGWVMLSCEHVMNHGEGGEGSKIGQPYYRKCICECNVVGELIAFDKGLDCAIANLNDERPPKNTILDFETGIAGSADLVDEIFAVIVGDVVRKRGSVTLLTEGVVGFLDVDMKAFRVDLIDDICFCDYGDSGSAVLNESNEVVGILFASEEETVTGIDPYTQEPIIELSGVGWVTAIDPILTAMKIEIIASAEGDLTDGDGDFAPLRSRGGRRRAPSRATAEVPQLDAALAHMFPANDTFWSLHSVEVFTLLDRNRAVKHAWARYQGPAVVGALLAYSKNPAMDIAGALSPLQPERLLLQMAAALQAHGSTALVAAVSAQLPEMLMKVRGWLQHPAPISHMDHA